MKRFNLIIFLASIATLVLITESCNKDESCPIGFSGENCEKENLCVTGSIVCQNGGTCIDGNCDCPDGYTGTNCELFDPGMVQGLLDLGKTPLELYEGNIPLDSIYGKMYKGGLIYYLNKNRGYGMVAATEDQSEDIDWGCMGNELDGADGIGVGSGDQNTKEILAACGEGIAADICAKYLVGVDGVVYDDWFLPSKN